MSLTREFLANSTRLFLSEPKNVLARNAMASTTWGQILINRDEFQSINHNYSNALPDMKITSQKASGRCWLFAALNLMRRSMKEKYNLSDEFELSQPYLFFYDKLEKCNYFLEQIIETTDEAVDSRLIQHLLTNPTNDGGQWDMLVNLIEKYGVVPKDKYPESTTSGGSAPLNKLLKSKLREFAKTLRTMHASGKSAENCRLEKEKMMEVIHRIMIIHLGSPPLEFDWSVNDKDKKNFKCYRSLSPQEFYKNHVGIDVGNYVSIVNDPRNPYNRTMTVERLGNIVGGKDVLYINTEIRELVRYTREMLDKKMPVWFGCDVGKESSMKKNGIMSKNIFNYDLVFGTSPAEMSKKDRLLYHEGEMTHAMLFTGYDVDQADETAAPLKWRVENSWGGERSDKGYDLMTRDWFDEHMYQIVVPKEMLSAEHLAVLDQEPIKLPVWDPMGSLA